MLLGKVSNDILKVNNVSNWWTRTRRDAIENPSQKIQSHI